MKRLWLGLVGILFDMVSLAVGFWAMYLAVWAGHEGTLEQFWFYRLTLGTLPLALVALASTHLLKEGAVRGWLRFALFEFLTFTLLAERSLQVEVTLVLLVDAAVYWLGLNAWRLIRPGERAA